MRIVKCYLAITFRKTRNPAVAEGPRDAGVPVEMSMSMSIVDL